MDAHGRIKHRLMLPAIEGVVSEVRQTWWAGAPVEIVRVQPRARTAREGGERPVELHDLQLRLPAARRERPFLLGDEIEIALAPEDGAE